MPKPKRLDHLPRMDFRRPSRPCLKSGCVKRRDTERRLKEWLDERFDLLGAVRIYRHGGLWHVERGLDGQGEGRTLDAAMRRFLAEANAQA